MLHKYIFPDEFDPLITNRISDDGPLRALTLVLDRASMPLPWEMACFVPPDESEETKDRIYFGTDLRLTRQFRTQLAGAPAIAPPVNRSLRVLVIADPAREPELRLEGARREGEELVALLRKSALDLKESGELDIEVVSRIGHEECRIVDILNLFFNKNFDVIHFSGHGIFDAEHPNHSGWVFGNNSVFSAREIFRTRRVPRLVFANACFSAATLGVGRPKGKARGRAGRRVPRQVHPRSDQQETGWDGRGILRARRAELHRDGLEGQRRGGHALRHHLLRQSPRRTPHRRRARRRPPRDFRVRLDVGRIPALRAIERAAHGALAALGETARRYCQLAPVMQSEATAFIERMLYG